MANIAAYAWEKGLMKQVVYRAADGHIHELFCPVRGFWSHADLTLESVRGLNAFKSNVVRGYGE
jgi:hypothetical protein